MSRTNKKLVVYGIIIALFGVVLSTLAPSAFVPMNIKLVGSGDPLITYPLSLILTLCQTAITPFGAMLAAFGLSAHIAAKDSRDQDS